MLRIPLSDLDSESGLVHTISVLQAGGLVIFPSDTVYGLLVDASNPAAVAKLLAFKERPPGKAISVFVRDIEMIEEHCDLSETQKSMLQTILPGPYTIVVPSKHDLAPGLESESGTLGVRIPKFAPVQMLVEAFGSPITATSANLSGTSPHYSIDALLETLPEKKRVLVDLVVDAGKLPHNKPSTVVDLTTDRMTILRVGDLLMEQQQVVRSKSEEDTRNLGAALLNTFADTSKPAVILLKGDLGAGKTVFTKGLAASLGVEDVISPTFVIYYEYDVPQPSRFSRLYHFDLYNIQESEELDHLGINELMKPNTILVVEWGDKIGDWFDRIREQAHLMVVDIEHVSPTERTLTVHASTS